jgi:hypothetical protein
LWRSVAGRRSGSAARGRLGVAGALLVAVIQAALADRHGALAPAAIVESNVLATTSRDSIDFRSRNSNQTALRPQLVVTYG